METYECLRLVLDFLQPTVIVVVLPIMVIWIVARVRINTTNKRTALLQSALEKNGEVDLEALMNKLEKPRKPWNERLFPLLVAGCAVSMVGMGSAILGIIFFNNASDMIGLVIFGGLLFSLGIGLNLAYIFARKSALKKENNKE